MSDHLSIVDERARRAGPELLSGVKRLLDAITLGGWLGDDELGAEVEPIVEDLRRLVARIEGPAWIPPASAEDAALDALVALCLRDDPGPLAVEPDPSVLSAEDREAMAGLGDDFIARLVAQTEADGGPPPLPRP